MPLAAPRTWVTAEVVTAALGNQEWRDQFQDLIDDNLFVRKTADTSRSSTTTTTADPHLTVALAASATYIMRALIIYDAGTTGDINLDWTIPTSAAGIWHGIGYGRDITTDSTSGHTIRMNSNTVSQARSFGGVSGSDFVVICNGLVRTSTTSGTYALEWAQAVSDATATIVRTDSFLELKRVA